MGTDVTEAPTVSVVMPAYNAERYIAEAVHSVLEQTFADLELIVMDDGSTDGTAEIMASFNDVRIRYVRHDRNRGLVAALNEGLDLARGEFIARMDADDRMVPERLQRQLDMMRADPGIAVLATFVTIMNPDGEETGVWDTDRSTVSEAEIRSMMPRTCCIAHPTVMIRRSALGAMRYDPRMTEGEDWGLWLRVLAKGLRIAKIPEPLLMYRQHAKNFTGAAQASKPLERRLLTMRRRFLAGEWRNFRIAPLHLAVLKAQLRTLARHMVSNVIPPFLRGAYRVLTYSPLAMLQEGRSLRRTLAGWHGEHVFIFPYLSMGGAEQVHTAVVASIADKDPLIIICGFSPDRSFEKRFAENGTLLEIPRLLNHPWTKRSTLRAIAQRINERRDGTVVGSLAEQFFDLIPFLGREPRVMYMLHAFLFQPSANQQHKGWLRYFDRIDAYLFPSAMAMDQFDKFLFHRNIPASRSAKLLAVPAASPAFGAVKDHDRIGVLFVGRDSPEKRLEMFLRMAADLEHRSPGRFRFTVAGPARRDGHSHVAFKGIVPGGTAMSMLYSEHDILVLTSTREGHCLVVTEAMAHGLAVLSTPVGDVADRVNERTGFVTSSIEEDVVAVELKDRIIALDLDRAGLRVLKENALELVKQRYDPGSFRMFYRDLLLKRRSGSPEVGA